MATPSLCLAEVEAELPSLRARADRSGWRVDFNPEALVLDVTIVHARTGELYVLRGRFDSYKSLPPAWDFVDPDTGEEGTQASYPEPIPPPKNPNQVPPVLIGGGARGRVICLPCNRLAFKESSPAAPHGDWKLVTWTAHPPSYTTIEEMVSRIAQDVQLSERRWAPRTPKAK